MALYNVLFITPVLFPLTRSQEDSGWTLVVLSLLVPNTTLPSPQGLSSNQLWAKSGSTLQAEFILTAFVIPTAFFILTVFLISVGSASPLQLLLESGFAEAGRQMKNLISAWLWHPVPPQAPLAFLPLLFSKFLLFWSMFLKTFWVLGLRDAEEVKYS